MDMSTTTAANGKLEILQRSRKKTPHGWVQDKDGNASVDPFILGEGGALLPLGSDRIHSSHKGYCLGSMVDILCGILPGANYGPWVPPFVAFLNPANNPVGEGIGHFFGAIRIDAFRPPGEFKEHMDNWIQTFKNAETIAGQEKVIIPGDPEREMAQRRRTEGIPLQEKVIESLQDVAKELNVDFPREVVQG
jgi:LDH2 family malate/lactate/ureidoglycolate dehydrogenase